MKKLWLTILLTIASSVVVNTAYAAGWNFYSTITVTSSPSIASGTNLNFPMLVSSTYSWLASASHGGNIQNLCTANNGGQEPCDLTFATSSANCTAGSYLNFETENYVSSTGALVDWVNVPSVSTGTVIYACDDNSSQSTSLEHASATWNSNYVGVFHFPTVNGLLVASDSTSYANLATITNVTATSSGAIDGGASFTNASSSVVTVSSTLGALLPSAQSFSITGWLNNQGIIDGLIDHTTSDDDLQVVNNGNFIFRLLNSASQYWALAGPSVASNKNLFFSAVYNASASALYAGINTTINSLTGVTTTYQNEGNAKMQISTNASGYNYWTGMIDETEFSKVPLSSQWLLTEYNNQVSPDSAQSSTTGFYTVSAQTAFGGVTLPTGVRQLFLNGKLFLMGLFNIK